MCTPRHVEDEYHIVNLNNTFQSIVIGCYKVHKYIETVSVLILAPGCIFPHMPKIDLNPET